MPRRAARTKGRPPGPRSSVGPDILVNATRELLRTRPPQAITRKDIARVARVDPALIRYYFRDKNNLLLAATMQIEREHRAREHAAVEAARTAPEKLKAKLRVMVEVMAENPHYNQLIQEQIHFASDPNALRARREMVGNSFSELKSILDEGVRTRALRPVEPEFLHVALVGMCQMFFNRAPLLAELFHRRVTPQKLASRYLEFAIELILGGVQAAAPARATRAAKPMRGVNGRASRPA